MNPEVQQAREIGELTASVKNTNAILERMENKLDSAIETVGSHSGTIALLAKVSTENSGAIVQIQETLYGRDKQSGIVRSVNELLDYKKEKCKLEEENRIATKRIFFSLGERIVIWIGGLIVAGLLIFKEWIK